MTDYIDRQAAIEALCDHCGYYTDVQCKTDSGFWCESGARIRELPPVEPKPACKDAVSISKVLEVFSDIYWFDDDSPVVSKKDVDKIYEKLRQLPTVEPERPKGEWEHGRELSRLYIGDALRGINYEDWHCSNCHCVVEQSIKPKWSYCPNCGADMRGDK